jgi:transposase
VSRYPTAAALAAASVAALVAIPHILAPRARRLIAEASQSVAGSASEAIGVLVREKAESILEQDKRIKRLERYLEGRFASDSHIKVLRSIRGVGPRIALWLRVVYGDFTRFPNAKAAVAYAGLDPMVEQSGDSVRKNRISKRGKGALRAVLYMGAQAAIGLDGPLRDFYARLCARGKKHNTAVVACMAKMVRIAYACVTRQTKYDLTRHAEIVERANAHRLAKEERVTSSTCTSAPVSRKEAMRRKRAAAPNEVKPQKTGSVAQPATSG